ncbi:transposable element Tc1 transposase [Trichonephila clavipes]|nr:transposable element Tc1 transposase [Trichonephila clavipes]
MTLQCKRRFRKSVNPEILRNVLRKHKYHGRVPQRKPYISKVNRQACNIRQPTEYWENVVFVEESKYNIFRSDGKQNFWRKSITTMRVKNLRPTIEYGGVTKLSGAAW